MKFCVAFSFFKVFALFNSHNASNFRELFVWIDHSCCDPQLVGTVGFVFWWISPLKRKKNRNYKNLLNIDGEPNRRVILVTI